MLPVYAATPAELAQLQTVRVVPLVFYCRVIAFLAFVALQRDDRGTAFRRGHWSMLQTQKRPSGARSERSLPQIRYGPNHHQGTGFGEIVTRSPTHRRTNRTTLWASNRSSRGTHHAPSAPTQESAHRRPRRRRRRPRHRGRR